MPNGDLVSKEVVNWTRSDRQRRYDIEVGVAPGSDPEQVMHVLAEAAKDVPQIMTSPAPLAVFKGFGESALNFSLLAWVSSVDVGLQAQNALRVGRFAETQRGGNRRHPIRPARSPYPGRERRRAAGERLALRAAQGQARR